MTDFLFKTEPSDYSFADLLRQGSSTWDGVRNPAALKTMREIKKGDRVFIYHTGDEKAVCGVARAVSEAYPDPQQPEGGPLVVVDLVPVGTIPNPVPLSAIKADPEFAASPLVRQGRLSVVRLSPAQAARIEKLGAGR